MGLRTVMIGVMVLLFAGCSQSGDDPDAAYEGREETRTLKAVDGVGYDGDAIRKSVDRVLDITDERQKRYDKAASSSE